MAAVRTHKGVPMNKGKLYIVATPIGNLEDITLRAIRILREVALIAAEDTRRTRKLLNAYGIATPLTSLYDQIETQKSPLLMEKLNEGNDIAFVSDAGTPGISDPGYVLVRTAIEQDIEIIAVPGPAAVIAALSVSGLPMDRFVFYGFPPPRGSKRKQFLESIRNEPGTMVFYESPRRLLSLLQEFLDTFGDRNIVVTRELTKIHEEALRGTVSDILADLKARDTIKGEITVILAGQKQEVPVLSPNAIRQRIETLLHDTTLSTKDIATTIADETHLSRKEAYKIVIEVKEAVS